MTRASWAPRCGAGGLEAAGGVARAARPRSPAADLPRQRARVLGVEQERVAAVGEVLAAAAAPGRDDGAPDAHRLQRHDAPGLAPADREDSASAVRVDASGSCSRGTIPVNRTRSERPSSSTSARSRPAPRRRRSRPRRASPRAAAARARAPRCRCPCARRCARRRAGATPTAAGRRVRNSSPTPAGFTSLDANVWPRPRARSRVYSLMKTQWSIDETSKRRVQHPPPLVLLGRVVEPVVEDERGARDAHERRQRERHAAHRPPRDDVRPNSPRCRAACARWRARAARDRPATCAATRGRASTSCELAEARRIVGLRRLAEAHVGGEDAHVVSGRAAVAHGGAPDELVAAQVVRRVHVADGEDAHAAARLRGVAPLAPAVGSVLSRGKMDGQGDHLESRAALRGRSLRRHTARGTIINGAFLVG